MAERTFPVGSIIKTGDQMAMIIGTVFDEVEDRLVKSYIIVAYPIGFTGWEFLRQIPAADAVLVSEGYTSPAAEPFLHFMDNLDIASEMADAQTINTLLEEAMEKVFGGDR